MFINGECHKVYQHTKFLCIYFKGYPYTKFHYSILSSLYFVVVRNIALILFCFLFFINDRKIPTDYPHTTFQDFTFSYLVMNVISQSISHLTFLCLYTKFPYTKFHYSNFSGLYFVVVIIIVLFHITGQFIYEFSSQTTSSVNHVPNFTILI